VQRPSPSLIFIWNCSSMRRRRWHSQSSSASKRTDRITPLTRSSIKPSLHRQSVVLVWWSAGKIFSKTTYYVLSGTWNCTHLTSQNLITSSAVLLFGGTAAAAPPPFRPGNCPLWEPSPSHPILSLTKGLAVFCVHVRLLCVWFVCVLFVPSVLWYCWFCLLTCKNRLPYNLYCVGGDVKHCSVQSNPTALTVLYMWRLISVT